MDPITSTVSPSLVSKVSSKNDALRAIGIELSKGEQFAGAFIVVKTEDGKLELRSNIIATTVMYNGTIGAVPTVPALVLRRAKDGTIKPNEATAADAVAQIAKRLADDALVAIAIAENSAFTPKGTKSDKVEARVQAVRDLSISGLRSK